MTKIEMEKKVQRAMASVQSACSLELSDEYISGLLNEEAVKRKEREKELGLSAYLLPKSKLVPSSINKQFLLSTVRDVNSHNKREQIEHCYRQHEQRKRASEMSRANGWGGGGGGARNSTEHTNRRPIVSDSGKEEEAGSSSSYRRRTKRGRGSFRGDSDAEESSSDHETRHSRKKSSSKSSKRGRREGGGGDRREGGGGRVVAPGMTRTEVEQTREYHAHKKMQAKQEEEAAVEKWRLGGSVWAKGGTDDQEADSGEEREKALRKLALKRAKKAIKKERKEEKKAKKAKRKLKKAAKKQLKREKKSRQKGREGNGTRDKKTQDDDDSFSSSGSRDEDGGTSSDDSSS